MGDHYRRVLTVMVLSIGDPLAHMLRAVLAARMFSDAVRLLLLIAAMTAVGFAVGFRVHTAALPALAGLVLTIAFGMAFGWVMHLPPVAGIGSRERANRPEFGQRC